MDNIQTRQSQQTNGNASQERHFPVDLFHKESGRFTFFHGENLFLTGNEQQAVTLTLVFAVIYHRLTGDKACSADSRCVGVNDYDFRIISMNSTSLFRR